MTHQGEICSSLAPADVSVGCTRSFNDCAELPEDRQLYCRLLATSCAEQYLEGFDEYIIATPNGRSITYKDPLNCFSWSVNIARNYEPPARLREKSRAFQHETRPAASEGERTPDNIEKRIPDRIVKVETDLEKNRSKGDKKINKYAVVLNGATEYWALAEVKRVSGFFKSNGYETYVASQNSSRYSKAAYGNTSAQLNELVNDLAKKIDDDDVLVVYAGGHGGDEYGGCLKMEDKCVPKDSPTFKKLFGLSSNRVVVINNCFSGNWASIFRDDPRTFFVSAGQYGKEVYVGDFDKWFFKGKVPDMDGDGRDTFKDRWLYTIKNQKIDSSCTIENPDSRGLMGIDGVVTRKANISMTRKTSLPMIYKVATVDQFERLIGSLRQDEKAAVMLSMPGCHPCRRYEPKFKKMTDGSIGAAFFIVISNGDDKIWSDLWQRLKIRSYPSVFLANNSFMFGLVENKEAPADEIASFRKKARPISK